MFCEATIRDADGVPVATATGLLKTVTQKATV